MSEAQIETKYAAETALSEYSALREEILKRMELRQALELCVLAGLSAVYGVVLGYDLSPLVAMAYPIVTFFLALSWSHHYYRSGQIGDYIRWYFETAEHGGPGVLCGRWQHSLRCHYDQHPGWYDASLTALGAGGVFMFSELLATGLGLYWWKVSSTDKTHLWWIISLLVVDVLALAGTWLAVSRRKRADRRKETPPHWNELLHYANPEGTRGHDARRCAARLR